jgi:hypothetical protein
MFASFVILVGAHILSFRNTIDELVLPQLPVFYANQWLKVFFLLPQKLSDKQRLPNYRHAWHNLRA